MARLALLALLILRTTLVIVSRTKKTSIHIAILITSMDEEDWHLDDQDRHEQPPQQELTITITATTPQFIPQNYSNNGRLDSADKQTSSTMGLKFTTTPSPSS